MSGALEANSVFAGYRVERLIGKGGMGTVYRAARIADGTVVALKLVSGERVGDPQFLHRFEREGRLAATLDQAHLVRVLEFGSHEGVPFLAMAFIEGIDLEYVLASQGALHPVTAVTVVEQVASALDAAHERGLVHRDVKPGNVLLARRTPGVHAYLTDFGLTKHVDSTSGLTKTSQWIGTVDYAAPEQIQAAEVDARTDVYALGCLLYEALTGSVPYPGERDVDKLVAHTGGSPPSASEHAPAVPADLDPVIARAMALRPEDRFQSAGELGGAAREAAAVAGPEPSRPIRFPAKARAVDSDAPTVG
jgi:serine/threonine protein kinase